MNEHFSVKWPSAFPLRTVVPLRVAILDERVTGTICKHCFRVGWEECGPRGLHHGPREVMGYRLATLKVKLYSCILALRSTNYLNLLQSRPPGLMMCKYLFFFSSSFHLLSNRVTIGSSTPRVISPLLTYQNIILTLEISLILKHWPTS